MERVKSYTRCVECKADVEIGVERHCPLCHATYPKGTQHTCAVLDEAVAEREPSTIPPHLTQAHFTFGAVSDVEKMGARSPWSPQTYRDFEVPKE